jgi:hypothetical protein
MTDKPQSYVDVELDFSVDVQGVQVKSLRLRIPRVKDMLLANKSTKSDEEKEVELFSHLTENSPDLIESLTLIDYKKLQEAYSNFLS